MVFLVIGFALSFFLLVSQIKFPDYQKKKKKKLGLEVVPIIWFFCAILLPTTSIILFFYLQPYKYIFVYSTFFFPSDLIYFVYLFKLISLILIQFKELLWIVN